MPLFQIDKQRLKTVEVKNVAKERELQRLIEGNLETVFNCRLVASEFPTGKNHGGRIDTLGLSEDNNPVIIEYKKVESSELINQSLYYLAWIVDHKGDFEIAARQTLGNKITIDFSEVRVICIAPHYRKFDLHAVQVMGANIELWRYQRFDNNTLYLEEVFQNPAMLAGGAEVPPETTDTLTPGQKGALTRATGQYTFDEHLKGKPQPVRELAYLVQDYMLGLDPSLKESPKKYYIGYKTTQNILCMQPYTNKVVLYVRLDPGRLGRLPAGYRDVRKIGHYGTGDLEITIKTEADFERAKEVIQKSYQNLGG